MRVMVIGQEAINHRRALETHEAVHFIFTFNRVHYKKSVDVFDDITLDVILNTMYTIIG